MKLKLSLFFLGFFLLTATSYSQINEKSPAANEGKLTEKQAEQLAEEILSEEATLIEENGNDYFLVQLPEDNQLLIQDTLQIKGINRTLSPVFIYDHLIDVREDGRFYGSSTLKTAGKHMVPFSVVTPEFEIKTIFKKVLRLKQPTDLNKFNENKQLYTYCYNVPFLYNPNNTRLLADPFTRADLAYLVSRIKTLPPVQTQSKEKVGETHWGNDYIRAAITKGYMSEFPDGALKPTLQVTKAEYIMTLVKALELELDFSQSALTYSDYNSTHWTSKFVRSAKNHQLIPSSGPLEFDKLMTVANFYELGIRVPQISKAMDQLLDFGIGYTVPKEFKQEQRPSISAFVAEYRQALESVKQLTVDSPEDKAIVLTRNVTIEGRIFPSELFKIGERIVTPDMDGSFTIPTTLAWGKNTFQLIYSGKTQSYTLHAIQPYSDLDNHWVSDTAARLRFAGFLENSDTFNPKEKLTRGTFSALLAKAFMLQKQEGALTTPSDVPPASLQSEAILAVISQGLLKADQQGLFYPNRELTKLEALAALVRVSRDDTATQDAPNIAFKDIPSTHWGYPIVQKALSFGLISPSPYFYPNKTITKPEFAAMLYRVPQVRKTMENL